MSKPDARQSVKLNKENSEELLKLSRVSTIKTSVATLANTAIVRSLPWLKKITPTNK